MYTPVWGNQFAAVHKALREALTVESLCDAPWSIVSDCKKGVFSRGCVSECLMLLESSLSNCVKIAGMPENLIEPYLSATWVWSMKNEQKMQESAFNVGKKSTLLLGAPALEAIQFQYCGEVALVCYTLSKLKFPLITEENILYLAKPMAELEILESNSRLFISVARSVREMMKKLKLP